MSEDGEQKKEDQGSAAGESAQQQQQQTPQVAKKRPVVGKPIGTPVTPPPAPAQQPTQVSAPTPASAPSQAAARPAVGRPTIGTPVGRPTVGQPIGTPATKPTVGQPAGTAPARPTVGQPAGAAAARPAIARPTVGGGPVSPGRPTTPPKRREETREEISRRNFLRGIVIVAGLGTLALSTYGALDFMTGTVESSGLSRQQIYDASTGAGNYTTPLSIDPNSPGYVAENNWKTFIYPRTGNVNIDADTFSQNVLIHLPKGWSAPAGLSYRDPSTGDYYVALSRVCVHLWCLWSYNPQIRRGACPCHGSQYQPGGDPNSSDPAIKLGATEPGIAVAGPASLQVAPNNQLPLITLDVDSSGNFYATGRIGAVGCGQKC